uniref:ATP synthase F0 subunit 8 n=1 Tax=Brachyistius frenatus TaxID=100188 RepID=UPI001BEFBB81|nr:ATP synthase F0 subunit 8 [Brachyistius frenatus]QUJ18215.1 ATP synthase protein 8 [Brachyistius frenatus]WCI18986.1 ATP synthase F0 subunit 8 [Brachyistius frenatus]WMI35746.1 ATP synthase F0 subunit 8 [Brachyistius frenatus]
MPQLNPSPWFVILIFSWVIFSAIIPPKILAHLFQNDPSSQSAKKSGAKSWGWPWH